MPQRTALRKYAIHRRNGASIDGWNIEYMDEVNGYDLMITYHADEGGYRISLSKNNAGGGFITSRHG